VVPRTAEVDAECRAAVWTSADEEERRGRSPGLIADSRMPSTDMRLATDLEKYGGHPVETEWLVGSATTEYVQLRLNIQPTIIITVSLFDNPMIQRMIK